MTSLPIDIMSRLRRFLYRRSVPSFMRGDDQAIEDELAAFLKIIEKFAPREPTAFETWWARLEADIGKRNITRSWPSEGEIYASCVSLIKKSEPRVPARNRLDALKINANRIRNREAVGEYWIRHGGADCLLRAGLVTKEEMNLYAKKGAANLTQ